MRRVVMGQAGRAGGGAGAGWSAMGLALVVASGLAAWSSGCERRRSEAQPEGVAPSPNASILPAPLAPTQRSIELGAGGAAAAGIAFDPQGRPMVEVAPAPAPEVIRAELAVSADGLTARETSGVVLSSEWRWVDVPAPPKAPEVHAEGLAAARRLTAFKWLVNLTESGRMRVLFDARAFPLPLGSELRARADRHGHVLVFPSGTEYRPVAPGALRSLFGERRLDVSPLVAGATTVRGAGATRLGLATRKTEVASRVGTVTLETARVPEAGQGGQLLCRALVELIAVDPSTTACARDEVPLRAQFTWPTGSGIVFEVHELTRRAELPLVELLCPPPAASYAKGAMPPQPSGIFLTRDEAAALRSRPTDVGPLAAGAPGEGVLARNATDSLRFLLIDGVPIAWVRPGAEQYVIGPPRGRYVAQWRTFLGDQVDPPQTIVLPGRIAVGEPSSPPGKADAGAPAPAKSR